MLGFKLFFHAVLMVLRNLKAVVQIFLLPVLILIGLAVGVTIYLFDLDPTVLLSGQRVHLEEPDAGTIVAFLVAALVGWFVLLAGVVNWHRYVLLEERPHGIALHLRPVQVLRYVGKALLILLVLLLPLLLVAFIVMPMMMPLMMSGNLGLAQLISTGINLLLLAFVLALSLLLPAAAIDRSFGMNDAILAMSGHFGSLLVCAGCILAMDGAGEFLVRLLWHYSASASIAASYVIAAVTGLIGVSVLTTLYGHFVEERPLAS